MLAKLPIEQEQITVFRAAVKAVTDSRVANAGACGELVFLKTKVFEQDYMDFCDNFIANDYYPEYARSKMQLRRDALLPFLGHPLLHGGLQCGEIPVGGFGLNVFVDKASGRVIHWELNALP